MRVCGRGGRSGRGGDVKCFAGAVCYDSFDYTRRFYDTCKHGYKSADISQKGIIFANLKKSKEVY